ncbi:MAG: NigD-like N-terminal domain-containing protein [Draconibacterium sp.]|nr:NigD-like N-terminal domain-containing protein [Draconibacterium sp.]
MKKIGFVILVGFMFVFAGCNDYEGYSLGDMWVGFGIFQVDGLDSYKIILDNKDVLIPVASNYPPGWGANIDNGERVFVNYTILDEVLESSLPAYYVKVNAIEDILMKDVMDITPEIEDSIGNDPIVVVDYWMTDSLLSFKLRYWGYYTTHFLNLVKQPGEILPENLPIELELRHNANNDDDAIYYTAYVSFSLNDLRIEGLDSVQFVVTSIDYDGDEFSEEFIFNYSDLPDDIRIVE